MALGFRKALFVCVFSTVQITTTLNMLRGSEESKKQIVCHLKKVASAHVLRSCTAVSTPFGADVYEISWKTNKDTSIVCDKGLAGNKGRTHGPWCSLAAALIIVSYKHLFTI